MRTSARDRRGCAKLRVLARHALENGGRLSGPAGEPQVVPEHDRIFRREQAVLFQPAQVRHRELVPSRGRERDRTGAPGHEQSRVFVQHGGELADGELRVGARRRHAAIERPQKMHAILGVAERPTTAW